MKGIFVILSLVLIVWCTLSLAWVSTTKQSVHPDHPDKCWSEEVNASFTIDESYRLPNTCAQAYCQSDFSFRITGCSSVSVPGHCVDVPVDLSKDYPDCCQSFKCD